MTRATDTAEFIRLVEGRVAALARAQTLLAETGGRGADLRVLATGEVEPVLAAEPDGPRLDLGRPGADGGRGRGAAASRWRCTSWRPMRRNTAPCRSRRGGCRCPGASTRKPGCCGCAGRSGAARRRPRAPEREGFGTKVLEATLVGQLGGTLRRDWPATGLVLEALLPLDRVAAEG